MNLVYEFLGCPKGMRGHDLEDLRSRWYLEKDLSRFMTQYEHSIALETLRTEAELSEGYLYDGDNLIASMGIGESLDIHYGRVGYVYYSYILPGYRTLSVMKAVAKMRKECLGHYMVSHYVHSTFQDGVLINRLKEV